MGTGTATRGGTAIVGTGLAGLGEAPGWSHYEIMAHSARAALADCGLTLADVDGLFAQSLQASFPGLSFAEYLGIRPTYVDGTNIGGSSGIFQLQDAALAIEAGVIDVALICYGSNQRTASGRLVSPSTSEVFPYERPYQPRYPMIGYAFSAARHMHQYGTTREQLAEVAVAARRWAAMNPDAFMREPLTVDDVINARPVCDPLTVRDCCLVTDGGGSVVMVRADRVKDLPRKPAYLLGVGGGMTHRTITMMPDVTTTSAVESGERAFRMAGLAPKDVDVVQVYDAFTINAIVLLEDLGFCPKGEGGRFISGGHIAPGGGLPFNTYGGGLSCTHPGMLGMFVLIEAVRQLQGVCGERQIPDVEISLAHGNGGMFSSEGTAVLGSAATV